MVPGTEQQILVGGNFIARAKRILEIAARIGLVVLNTGSTPTFPCRGCEGSIPDITFASESLASSVDEQQALQDFSASDYQYTAFEVIDATCRRVPIRRSPCLWTVGRVNIGKFVEALGAGRSALKDALGEAPS